MIDLQLIYQSIPLLLKGVWVTLQISLLSSFIGFVLGTTFGILQGGKNKIVSILITIYTTIIRGTPMLIQILFVAFALPQMGINIPLFWGAVVAIGLNSSAYICNIIRSGIASVGKGQVEAAKVLGLSNYQIVRFIVLPQAVRMVLPALGNEFITLIKDSSLASTIGVMELTLRGRIIASQTYDIISTYTIVALLYLILTTSLSLLLIKLEQRMNYHAQH